MNKEQRQRRTKELLKEIPPLFFKSFHEVVESDNYKKIKEKFLKELGIKLGGIKMELNMAVILEDVEDFSENKLSEKGAIEIHHQFTPGDDIRAHNFGITIKPEDISELESNLEKARTEHRTSEQQKLLPAPRLDVDDDPRAAGQIINDIRTVARKLDSNSRLSVAKKINIEIGTHIPTAERSVLSNDTFWLQQIQATISRIRELGGAKDKIKSLLLSLESIVKSRGEES